MSPLQSWIMILLLVFLSIALTRIFTASAQEWRELFSKSTTPTPTPSEEHLNG